eukprot:gene10552-7325_t
MFLFPSSSNPSIYPLGVIRIRNESRQRACCSVILQPKFYGFFLFTFLFSFVFSGYISPPSTFNYCSLAVLGGAVLSHKVCDFIYIYIYIDLCV